MAKMKSVRTITDTVTDSGIENYEKNCDKASEISIDIVLGLLKEIKAYILGGKNDEEWRNSWVKERNAERDW